MVKKIVQSGNGLLAKNSQSNQCMSSYLGRRVEQLIKEWQAEILEKIKIFMWFVEQKTILAKDVMLKRNWQGDPRCYFYGLPESCDHLPRVIWGLIAICLQQNTRPSTYEQFWVWIKGALPRGEKCIC
jgi:hypothetical protein